jgi:nucleotide-binding universal stress UspA family protein
MMLRVPRFARCDKIVVGVTPDSGARNALRWGIRAALVNDALLVAVTAFEVPPAVLTMFGWACFDSRDAKAAAEFMQHNVLDDELLTALSPARIRRSVIQGDPVRVLVAAATDADLLVVGRQAHRSRAIAKPSISKRCANRAVCPVVIVREDLSESHVVGPTLQRSSDSLDSARDEAVTGAPTENHPHRVRRHSGFERRRH